MKVKTEKKVKEKICKVCEKSFVPYSSLSRYCSQKCSMKEDKIKDKERKEKVKKKKKESISVLVKTLDTLVSKYIRNKYSKNWICTCISCWKELPISEAHNCHWINRWIRLYRFDEDNLATWCPWCNLFNKEYHLREYTFKQIDRLWIDKVNEMRVKAREVWKKPSKEWLQEQIEFYKLKEYDL
mgnify:CR=1 FL=1